MKRHAKPLQAALFGITLTFSAKAQDDAQSIAEGNASSYVEAWESGNIEAIASLYTEDAEYTSDDGTLLSGRAAIQEQTESALSASEGATLSIEVESARFLTPDVVAENGYATISADGTSTTTMYNATHVKTEGKWLIAEVHESVVPEVESDLSAAALTRLEWLVGSWKVDREDANAATAEIKWVLDGRFLLRTTTIPAEEEEAEDFVAVELIGYDPVDDRIRSWVFDNEGGFGDGHWMASEGNEWSLTIRATGPDGGVSSGMHTIDVVDEDTLTLESTNRVLDGEVLPNRDSIKLVRVGETSTASEQ